MKKDLVRREEVNGKQPFKLVKYRTLPWNAFIRFAREEWARDCGVIFEHREESASARPAGRQSRALPMSCDSLA
jgi:hypothetical protein